MKSICWRPERGRGAQIAELKLANAGLPKPVPLPATRGDCIDGPRPCPHMRCKYHLALDVSSKTGTLKLNHPDLELDELAETCALDVAADGEHTLAEVARLMNITTQRARQIEDKALFKLKDGAHGRKVRKMLLQ